MAAPANGAKGSTKMHMGPVSRNPKHFGAVATGLNATSHSYDLENHLSSQTRSMGIPGEPRDPIGHSPSQMLTQDYSNQKHMAYDSPLAQPAYSEHGKVGGGNRF